MPRRGKGYSTRPIKKTDGKWYGLLRIYRGPNGKEKDYTRQGKNKTHAKQLAAELEAKYITGGTEALDAEFMTVGELAEHYKKAKVIDPIYDGDIKVAGMQAKESAEKEIKSLLEYWATVRIQQITHAAVEEYKIAMLKKPVVYRYWKQGVLVETRREAPRKMASVNHLLRRLRAMLNFAKRKGWIMVNPFNQGEPLISEAAEVPRNRAEKERELQNLIAACTGRCRYLRPFILIMTDSALRLSEAKRITRAEIDFDRRVANVRARNTKGNRERTVPLSDRLIAELREWCEKAEGDDVPILRQGEHKSAWKAVKKAAGIHDDLQLRDLRGWGTGRIARALAKANLPREWGMKTTGHTQIKTYLRYIKTDEEVAQQTGEALKNLDDQVA